MFAPSDAPRLYALPPGADFPAELARGVRMRMEGRPPEEMARVQLYVNTRRMARRLHGIFADGPALLLPRIRLVTELADDPGLTDLPPAVPPLRRRLELAQLVARLLEQEPDLAPRAASWDLADSLAALMDEMQGEGVPPDALERLDVSDQSGHWHRALAFIRIVGRYFEADTAPDPEARQRRAIEALVARWQVAPPRAPVIVAGSTGSRGATALLMEAVARLPQGALVLPGFDFAQPGEVWAALDDQMTSEDHPQYRFARLMGALGLGPDEVGRWTDRDPVPERNRLISMALRPAPVTDQWMREGPGLGDMVAATAGMALIEAPDPRIEALAIALRLRAAAMEGRSAALVTPDRTLTRQVTAALDRWRIEPDDSAGRPLSLSAPGRLLRQVAALMGQTITPEPLLALLKHPLVHSGAARGRHLLMTRELELWMRRQGPPFPVPDDLRIWADGDEERLAWVAWLEGTVFALPGVGAAALPDLLARHLDITERLAAGPGIEGSGALWEARPGEAAQAATEALAGEAAAGGAMSLTDYVALFYGVLNGEEVRDPARPHPGIAIWGTLEARVQGADLVILAGLSDGIWPEMPAPDPWLNRQMRAQAGLLLPDRRIGLSAHDYQQAVAAREVVLTRSTRNAEAETVMSRWLNRLTNLLSGLRGTRGPEALDEMRALGAVWLERARALDARRIVAASAPRPAPAPPAALRPVELSVTEIERLVRDPYAVYARRILRLRPLDPLRRAPDAPLRGSVIHSVFEQFLKEGVDPAAPEAAARLVAIAEAVFAETVPWPAMRQLWLARIAGIAPWFVEGERRRRDGGEPLTPEAWGSLRVPGTGVTIRGKADRIDRDHGGRLTVLDYKTGKPPAPRQIRLFDRQLLIEAAMAEAGAFEGIDAAEVSRIVHIGLGATPVEQTLALREPLKDDLVFDPGAALLDLQRLLDAYADPRQGYASRRQMERMGFDYGYDHLARFGEWAASARVRTEIFE